MNAIHGAARLRALARDAARAPRALARGRATRVRVLQAAGFDLILVETAGIGQSDSEIVDLADISVYVMTPEYGAPSQLEKIDMLDLADLVVLNKCDRRGAQDALRDVRKQWRRNRGGSRERRRRDAAGVSDDRAASGTIPASTALYAALRAASSGERSERAATPRREPRASAARRSCPTRASATSPRSPRPCAATAARPRQQARARRRDAWRALAPRARCGSRTRAEAARDGGRRASARRARSAALDPALRAELDALAGRASALRRRRRRATGCAASAIDVENHVETLSGTQLPKVALPRDARAGASSRASCAARTCPGRFPFTAGVFPFKRDERGPDAHVRGRGRARAHQPPLPPAGRGQPAARLSTAFDSVTLYGRDPDERPDIYGKVGNSGVSVCTLDDAKKLYSGFDLAATRRRRCR